MAYGDNFRTGLVDRVTLMAADLYRANVAKKTPIRIGQAVSIALEKLAPNLSFKVIGAEFDPYVDNNNIPAFYEWLVENTQVR